MTRAGIYARISLDVSGDALGVQRQEQDCRTKAAALGWDVAEVYVDNDVSASKNVERPAYARMLADLEAGTINAVVVYDLDRLTRKPAELESFIDLSDKHGVSLANVSGDVDLTTASGRMVARIKGAVARQEAERIGERVARQKQQRAAQGIPHKGRHRQYGYDEDWNLIPSEAAIIKEAFMRRANGESTTSIANDFTQRGIKTVSGRNWTSGVLGVTLKKDVYAGWVTLKGVRVAKSIYPAIVDEATFNAAQSNLANDSAGTNTRKYLLSGILMCKHCLSPMKGNPSNQMYRCSTTYGGCGRLSVRIELADKWIPYAALEKSFETADSPTAPVRDYQAEIDELTAKRTQTQEAFEAGIYDLKEARNRINAIRDQIAELTKEQAKQVPRMNRATRTYMDFQRMNLAQKRAFISSQIVNVVVGPSISRGNQPFNPSRFEVHYQDGTVAPITSDGAGEALEAPESP